MGTLREMLLMTYPVKAYTLNNGTIVYKEYQSYAASLDVLREIADEILRERISSTAQSRGLEFYEGLCGPVRDDLTLEKRREMICSLLTLGANDNTLAGIRHFFDSVGIECDIIENPSVYDVYIYSHDHTLSRAQQDNIIDRAGRFMPYHLTFTVDFRTIDFGGLDALELTFQEIDDMDMTWQDFERFNGEVL